MLKGFGFVLAAVTALALSAPANADVSQSLAQSMAVQTAQLVQAQTFAGFNWKVGDKTNHKIEGLGGLLKGTSAAFVREDTGTHFWLQQDADLGAMGKQKIETLLNKSNGKIEKLLVNGEEQQIPESNPKVDEMKEAHIKVTAGEFDCVYVKVSDTKTNQTTEAWINMKQIPMTGVLKAIQGSQFGPVTQELLSFEFAK